MPIIQVDDYGKSKALERALEVDGVIDRLWH